MAPRTTAPPRRKAGQEASQTVHMLGFQGRKTGLVLPDSGIRDENGIEPLKGIFDSSPAKGDTPSRDGDTSEVDMDIENTPGPDPRSVLKNPNQTVRRPMPRSRSPPKAVGASLQSPAMRGKFAASPLKPSAANGNGAPPSAASSQPTSRRLDFGKLQDAHTLPRPDGANGRAARVISSDAAEGEEDDEDEQEEDEMEMERANGYEEDDDADQGNPDDSMQMVDAGADDEEMGEDEETGLPAMNDDSADHDDASEAEEEEEEEEEEEVEAEEPVVRKRSAAAASASAVSAKQRLGRKPRANGVAKTNTIPEPEAAGDEEDAAEGDNDGDADDPESEDAQPVVRKRGRPPKSGTKAAPAAAPSPAEPPKRRRAMRNSSGGESSLAAEAEDAEQPASKRQKVVGSAAGGKAASRGRKPVAAEKGESSSAQKEETTATAKAGPNAGKRPGRPPKKMATVREADNDDAAGAGDTSVVIVPRPPLPKRSGLVINRRDVPGESSAFTRTRSGRNSFKPLAFWKNEHVEHDVSSAGVMEDGKGGKSRFLLPSIKEVLRVEDESPPRPKKYGGHRRAAAARKKAQARRGEDDDDDDDEGEGGDEAEQWERDPGEVVGPVTVWEPEHQVDPPGVDDEVAVKDEVLAFSSSAIKTRDILGASFRFTKTLSTPFFGTGVVDLPAGAEKKTKNSRKMHMMFVVHTGRVSVDVNETAFSIGRGGMWFVPRGNYYSIKNESSKPSRIFFAQACEILRDASTLKSEQEAS